MNKQVVLESLATLVRIAPFEMRPVTRISSACITSIFTFTPEGDAKRWATRSNGGRVNACEEDPRGLMSAGSVGVYHG
jgi:hypothetical protein